MMKEARRQSAQNRWARDPNKQGYWQCQIRLWQASGLSVRGFCKEHGVIETSFYAWRRELLIRAREGLDGTVNLAAPNAVNNETGESNRTRFRQTDHRALQNLLEPAPAENPFVRLSLAQDQPASLSAVPKATKSELSITTPSGYRITVGNVEEIDLLKLVLASLEEKEC